MLAAMLLHQIQSSFPVDFAFHGASHSEGCIAQVANCALLFLHIQYTGIPQRAQIAGLSAAFGIESRGAEGDLIAAFYGGAGSDLCGKAAQVTVFVK